MLHRAAISLGAPRGVQLPAPYLTSGMQIDSVSSERRCLDPSRMDLFGRRSYEA